MLATDRMVCTPGNFDEEVQQGKIPPADLQACTMMTLDRLQNDLCGAEMHNEHWIRQCPPEVKRETRGVWPLLWTRETKVPNALSHIHDNREYFRWQMGLRDALFTLHPTAAKTIYQGKHHPLLYTNKFYDSTKPIRNINDLRELVVAAHTYPQYQIDQKEADVASRIFLEALETVEAVNGVLLEAQRRQGVQVVYGVNGFEEYLQTFGSSLPQGDTPYALCMPFRVPPEYITAILPIGEYEQNALGLRTKE